MKSEPILLRTDQQRKLWTFTYLYGSGGKVSVIDADTGEILLEPEDIKDDGVLDFRKR